MARCQRRTVSSNGLSRLQPRSCSHPPLSRTHWPRESMLYQHWASKSLQRTALASLISLDPARLWLWATCPIRLCWATLPALMFKPPCQLDGNEVHPKTTVQQRKCNSDVFSVVCLFMAAVKESNMATIGSKVAIKYAIAPSPSACFLLSCLGSLFFV